MKNKLLAVLSLLTALFLGLTVGLFLGRNAAGEAVTVSVSSRLQTAPSASPETTEETGAAVVYPINVNTADRDTLTLLPGIGPVLAQRIIDYRDRHGPFTAAEQLTSVEGIGEGRAEAIMDLITVGG